MKRLIYFCIFATLVLCANAQNTSNDTNNPYVERPYPSNVFGSTKITGVTIMDGFTVVSWTYTTGRNSGSWVSLSSRTYILANGERLPIRAWATDTDPISELEFDKHLNVEPNTTYNLLMIFPQVPVGIEKISIIEPIANGGEGFAWRGIHINNSTRIVASQKSNAEYTGVGSELIGKTFRVTNNTTNGENNDHLSLTQDHAIHFYVNNDGEFSFSNHWRVQDSQSFGPIYSMKVNRIPESETTYAATEYKFTWKYYNTYDDKQGSAVVTFNVIHMGEIKKFTCKVVALDTNMILEYTGYLE